MSCGRVLVVLASALSLWPQSGARPLAKPAIGKSARYCNPLPLETSSQDGSPQGVSLGDVTVVREGDLYYLFGTGGGAWVSPDLVNWKYWSVDVHGCRLPLAPHAAKYNGAFYMSGNSAPLYRAPNILGPYEVLGPWLNEKGDNQRFLLTRVGGGRVHSGLHQWSWRFRTEHRPVGSKSRFSPLELPLRADR